MNAMTLARIVPARTDTFDVWRQVNAGRHSFPVDHTGTTLAETLAECIQRCGHKDRLIVRHHDAVDDTTRLLIYAIKRQSRPDYRAGERVQPLYADLLFDLPVLAFDPVEPWRWEPGADVVGRGLAVVEGARS